MNRSLAAELASRVDAYTRCCKSKNEEWAEKHGDEIQRLCENYLPHGSGLDNITTVDCTRSNAEKLVITTSYHHMNNCGMYDGWTEHEVIVTPGFNGLNIRITGRDRNAIKEYLADTFRDSLESNSHALTTAS